MPRCTNDKSLITAGLIEIRQVQSTPPWFDVYLIGKHWYGTLNSHTAFAAITSFDEMLAIYPLAKS